ncbi:MAG: hypothetical protein ACI8ZB_001524 [Desulforhopalus sp.]|jgi:hypothetical protein
MSSILRHLDVVKICPHCNEELSCCEAPPIHVGDGLGWGSEVLFICLNDACSVFLKGWDSIEEKYGHHSSYRYMELPDSKEKNYMMVGNADAFKSCVIDKEELRAQNKQYQKIKIAEEALKTCVADKNIEPVLTILLDEGAGKKLREEAAGYIAAINNLDCVDPLRNHNFRDSAMKHWVDKGIKQLLENNFKKECPHCSEIIKAQATKCMHCKENL